VEATDHITVAQRPIDRRLWAELHAPRSPYRRRP
jgi:hypothetical protein